MSEKEPSFIPISTYKMMKIFMRMWPHISSLSYYRQSYLNKIRKFGSRFPMQYESRIDSEQDKMNGFFRILRSLPDSFNKKAGYDE